MIETRKAETAGGIVMQHSPNLYVPEQPSRLLEALHREGYEAYVVGGCVRDSLMGKQPHDWDICTSALPEQIEQVFQNQRIIKTGIKHGTVSVLIDSQPYEITTFRTDGVYSDHRRPDHVCFVSSLREDLSRRDFTINAMAYSAKTGIIDYFRGQEDLQKGLIRCVGDPDRRFSEDGLRLMRALRFAARLSFEIEPETALAINKDRDLLKLISAERIFSELKGLLLGQDAGRMMHRFSDVIFTILPELASMRGYHQPNLCMEYDLWQHTCNAIDAAPTDITVRLALLFHDAGAPQYAWDNQIRSSRSYSRVSAQIAAGCFDLLKADNATKKAVTKLIAAHEELLLPDQDQLRLLVSKMGPDRARQFLQMCRADAAALGLPEDSVQVEKAASVLDCILKTESCFSIKDLEITGTDLIALGIPAGKRLGKILQSLLNDVLKGSIANEKQVLLCRAQYLIQTGQREEEGNA